MSEFICLPLILDPSGEKGESFVRPDVLRRAQVTDLPSEDGEPRSVVTLKAGGVISGVALSARDVLALLPEEASPAATPASVRVPIVVDVLDPAGSDGVALLRRGSLEKAHSTGLAGSAGGSRFRSDGEWYVSPLGPDAVAALFDQEVTSSWWTDPAAAPLGLYFFQEKGDGEPLIATLSETGSSASLVAGGFEVTPARFYGPLPRDEEQGL